MLVVAVLIKLTSRGPVSTPRPASGWTSAAPGPEADNHRRTKDIGGKPFQIYKFRTMQVDAEAGSGAVWATPSDPRLTPIGGFLRQYRLDEIPQLFNVLKGDMNVVGPRPERPQLFEGLKETVDQYQYPPAGQAGHHRPGADQSAVRHLPGRRAAQGPVRPRVPAPPQPGQGHQDHGQDGAGGVVQEGWMVEREAGKRGSGEAGPKVRRGASQCALRHFGSGLNFRPTGRLPDRLIPASEELDPGHQARRRSTR